MPSEFSLKNSTNCALIVVSHLADDLIRFSAPVRMPVDLVQQTVNLMILKHLAEYHQI